MRPLRHSLLACAMALALAAPAAHADDAAWTPLDGPWGGPIVALAVAPDTGHLYAAQSQRVLVSTDGGATWADLPGSGGIANVLSLTAGPGGRVMVGVMTRGVWWTLDDGASWDQDQITHDPHGGLGASVTAVAVTPSDDMFATHWRSLNDGATWLEMSISGTAFAFLSDGTAVAGSSDGVHLSTTNGATWTPASNGIETVIVRDLAVTPDDVIFAASWPSVDGGLYRSENRGQTWQPVHAGLGTPAVTAVAADGAGRVFAGTAGAGLQVSEDLGDTWQPVAGALPDPTASDLVVGAGDRLYTGLDAAGVHASDDQGATWTSCQEGMAVPYPRALLPLDATTLLVGATGSGVFLTEDGGETWAQSVVGLAGTGVNALALAPDGAIHAGSSGGLATSLDGGRTWEPGSADLAWLNVQSVHADPAGRLLAWIKNDPAVVMRSLDDGATWAPVVELGDLAHGGVFEDAVMDGDGRMYLGGLSWLVHGLLLVSDDGGETWDHHDLVNMEPLEALAVAPDGKLFTATEDGVFASTDFGASWSPLASTPWDDPATTLLATAGGSLLAGTTNQGIFRTTDDGATWEPFLAGLPQQGGLRAPILELAEQNGHALASTAEQGILRTPLTGLTAAPDEVVRADDALLQPNYPNPFNPRTTIAFTATGAGPVRLTVHDLAGRLVRVLLDSDVAAGPRTLTWDGRDDTGRGLPSGVYVCRLQVVDRVEAIRMVLAR